VQLSAAGVGFPLGAPIRIISVTNLLASPVPGRGDPTARIVFDVFVGAVRVNPGGHSAERITREGYCVVACIREGHKVASRAIGKLAREAEGVSDGRGHTQRVIGEAGHIPGGISCRNAVALSIVRENLGGTIARNGCDEVPISVILKAIRVTECICNHGDLLESRFV